MGLAESGFTDARTDFGVLHDHAFFHTALRCFAIERIAYVDILLAVSCLRSGIDRQ